ncbi:MAG: hypothetical protein RI959_1024 [Pseudomonadota bacterium]|jgi:hypothetical protein
MDQQTQRMLKQGISDAVGFVGGALGGYWLSHLMGWELFSEAYDNASIMGILAVGLGGGAGLHAARIWQKANLKETPKD